MIGCVRPARVVQATVDGAADSHPKADNDSHPKVDNDSHPEVDTST